MLTDESANIPITWQAPTPPHNSMAAPSPTPPVAMTAELNALDPFAAAQPHETIWTFERFGPPMPPMSGNDVGNGGSRRRRSMARFVVITLALLATLVVGFGLGRVGNKASSATIGARKSPVVSVSSNVTSIEQSLKSVATAVTPSVVEIKSVAGNQEAIGSGDILTTSGYIVTNDHVVDGYTSYTVILYNGTTLTAQLVGKDPQDDLAVIKVSASNLQPIAFADSSKLQVGVFAIAIGNPYGQRETATFGTVSGLNRTESESPEGPAAILTGLVQTSAPIAPGNSGGALVNMQGQLIGIPTLGATSQQTEASGATTTVGFAIPSNEVKSVAQQLIQTGHVTTTTQSFLGIQGQDVTPQVASAAGLATQSGVLITGFASDAAGQSPAQAAGLQTGDVVVAVDGVAITSSSDLAGAMAGDAPGRVVTVTFVRGSSQRTTHVTLGQRPANA